MSEQDIVAVVEDMDNNKSNNNINKKRIMKRVSSLTNMSGQLENLVVLNTSLHALRQTVDRHNNIAKILLGSKESLDRRCARRPLSLGRKQFSFSEGEVLGNGGGLAKLFFNNKNSTELMTITIFTLFTIN